MVLVAAAWAAKSTMAAPAVASQTLAVTALAVAVQKLPVDFPKLLAAAPTHRVVVRMPVTVVSVADRVFCVAAASFRGCEMPSAVVPAAAGLRIAANGRTAPPNNVIRATAMETTPEAPTVALTDVGPKWRNET